MLQVVASIFDPLGYFAPAILEAKIFIQKMWADKLEWDTKLAAEQLSTVQCKILVGKSLAN